jgi:iron complex transport system substrate-binding protein
MRRREFVVLAALAVASGACARERGAAKGGPASRVVSLSPSTTEALFAIGGGDRLVGRSRYCDWPEAVKALPQVGGYVDPSFEAILALKPDLVIGARGPAGSTTTERLEARGVATFFPATETLAAIEEMMLGLGARVGRRDAAARRVTELRARVKAVEDAAAGRPRRRVLLVFGLSPLVVAGPSSFADEMLRRAGGTNVVSEGGAYPTIGVERVLTLDPDVVVNAAMAEELVHERLSKDAPGWGKVRAVAEGRVVRIAEESVLRPGPRVGDGLATLARAIHPEAKIP